MIVRSVKPLSVAKIAVFLYALIGLFAGVVMFFVFTVGTVVGARSGRPGGIIGGFILGGGALIVMPVLYSAFGFVITLIMSALYNWAASFMGGIEIEIDAATPPQSSSVNL